jgi:hypothetical protein
MTMTTTEANNYLNVMRGTTFAAYSPFACLFTADPTVAGTLTAEVGTRQALTFGAPANKATANTGALTFSGLAPGTVITHTGIADAASAGALRRYTALGAAITVGSSGQVTVAVGAFTDTAG